MLVDIAALSWPWALLRSIVAFYFSDHSLLGLSWFCIAGESQGRVGFWTLQRFSFMKISDSLTELGSPGQPGRLAGKGFRRSLKPPFVWTRKPWKLRQAPKLRVHPSAEEIQGCCLGLHSRGHFLWSRGSGVTHVFSAAFHQTSDRCKNPPQSILSLTLCYSKTTGLISCFKQPCTEQQPRVCCWPAAGLFPLVFSEDLQKSSASSAQCSQRRVQSYSVNPFFVSSITSAWMIWWWHQPRSHPSWCLEDQGLESPFFYQSGMTQCY